MLKYTFKLTKSLLVLFGRISLIIGGLVFFSSLKAIAAFFSSQPEEIDEVPEVNTWSSVNDLQSAQASFSRGETDESTIAHYWATEDYRK